MLPRVMLILKPPAKRWAGRLPEGLQKCAKTHGTGKPIILRVIIVNLFIYKHALRGFRAFFMLSSH